MCLLVSVSDTPTRLDSVNNLDNNRSNTHLHHHPSLSFFFFSLPCYPKSNVRLTETFPPPPCVPKPVSPCSPHAHSSPPKHPCDDLSIAMQPQPATAPTPAPKLHLQVAWTAWHGMAFGAPHASAPLYMYMRHGPAARLRPASPLPM